MRRTLTSLSLLTAATLLQGCSGDKEGAAKKSDESNAVTQTRMDNIDSLEGTISDEMIVTDDSTDESALETTYSETAADTDKAAPADKSAAAAGK